VNWLVRQLKDAPNNTRVESFTMHARGAGAAELPHRVRQDPTMLISDPTKDVRAFRVAQTSTAGSKRGSGRGSFIDSVVDAIDTFYEQVIQNLKPWMPAPPRLRSDEEIQPTEPVSPNLVSTAISSQDGTEPAPAATQTADASDEPSSRDDAHGPDPKPSDVAEAAPSMMDT
jgi:hypothetical protein